MPSRQLPASGRGHTSPCSVILLPEAKFKVKSIMLVDGQLAVEWDPDLNESGTKTASLYILEEETSMDGEWKVNEPDSRFFRVRVEMPQAAK